MNKIIKVALVVLLISIIGIVGVGCVVDKNNTGDKDNTDDKGNTGGEKDDNPVNPPYVAEGDFYNMQAAYDAGILTVEDLQSIAYYYNGKSDIDGFVPKPQVPTELSDDVLLMLKKEFCVYYNIPEDFYPPNTNSVQILRYFGIYNDAIAMLIDNDYILADINPIDYVVAGVTFHYYTYRLYVWKSLK